MKISTAVVQQAIASSFGVSIAKVQPDTKFTDLGAESLDMVQLIMDIETALDIEVTDEATPTDTSMTVAQYVTALEKYCEALP